MKNRIQDRKKDKIESQKKMGFHIKRPGSAAAPGKLAFRGHVTDLGVFMTALSAQFYFYNCYHKVPILFYRLCTGLFLQLFDFGS